MTQVTSFGTPGMVRATSGSVTGSWGSGQSRTAGNQLVALVTAGGSTASAAAISTPSGWTQQVVTSNVATTANAWVAVYTKTAAGSDSAPAFTATLSGTVAMTVTLFELAAAANLNPVDTYGTYASGGTAGTLTLTATTSGNVSVAGEFAVTCFCMERAAATNTWTHGSGWANAANDGTTNTVLHTAVDYYANPSSGSTLAETGSWATETTAYGAGIILTVAPQLGGIELYQNDASTTISSGGTDAPASGTPEFLTAASWSSFPAASNTTTPPTKFHGADPAAPSELFEVLNTTTGLVIRGAQGTTPVTHSGGFTVQQVIPAGNQQARVYNVRDPQFGAKGDGSTDDYPAIQAALTACRGAGGGIVHVPAGVYPCSQILQIGSSTWLRGSGATIQAISGFNPSQVGANPGISVLTSYNYGSPRQSRIRITGITFDGNESNIPEVPSWALQVECSPLGMGNVDFLTIDHCEVINAIGYSIHPKGCNHVNISDNHVLSGQVITGSPVYVAQDCIHLIDCQYVVIKGNHVNSGSLSNSGIPIGDDGICIQGVVTGSSDVTISGNVVEASAARGISLVLGGATVQNVTITGNDVSNTQSNSMVLEYGVYVNSASYLIKNVAIVGNTFSNMALGGAGRGIQIDDATNTGNAPTYNAWQDVAITGNSFVNFQDNVNAGVYVQKGSGLQIMSNTFDNWNGGKGIQIGDYGLVGVNSNTVTGFQVVGNTINMSTSTGTAPQGILVIDSTEGCISGNVIIGPGSGVASSYGIEILDFATATLNLTVADNSITAWSQAIAEFNGGAEPDYNTISGNALHGCATGVTVSGVHTFAQTGIIDLGGIPDTEQFVCLSSPYTLTSTTAEQNLFNATTAGALTLAAGTYFFECEFQLTGMSTASGSASFSVLGAGTAGVSSTAWNAVGMKTTLTTGAAQGGSFQVASTSSGAIMTAGTASAMGAQIKGVLRIGTGGTIIPSVGLTTAIAAVVSANSWFRIWPVSASVSATYAGNWS